MVKSYQEGLPRLREGAEKLSVACNVPNSTPTAGLFLELGILPAQFVIELRQLTFLKKILDRDQEDPVKRIYNEMLKYPAENN